MKIIKRISKTQIGHTIIGYLIFLITRFVFKSISWECLNIKNQKFILDTNKPLIFCCWHNRLFLGPHFLPKSFLINALQSNHSDAIMNVTFRLLKINTISGSSKKGGTKAFMQMIKSIERGERIAISPDGPKGPKQKLKDGLIKLAQVTGTPIVPLVWFTEKNKVLNSWDHFIIPFPFSRGVFLFGDPIYVERKLNKNDFFEKKKTIENKLNHLTTLTEKKYIK